MENLKKKNFALFLNHFSSLKAWDENGTLMKETLLYRRLAEHFNHITIFSYGDRDDLAYAKKLGENFSIITRNPKIPSIVHEFLLPFIHWKTIRHCDVLKTNQNSGAIAPTIAKILFGKKLIIRSGYIGSEFARMSNLPLIARSYFFIAEHFSYFSCNKAFIPEGDSKILLKKYSFLKKRLVVVNNAINTDLFKKIDCEKKYDIVYQGRLDNVQKNHLTLLKAIEGLNLKVLFVGKGSQREHILAEAKKGNVDVTIIERVPNEELPDVYNSAKICAFPSLFEGNPKALLECMSCEMPIAAFSVPGVSNLIENEKSGLISEPSETALRNNIQKLLADHAFAEKLGKEARNFILEHYSFEKIFQKEFSVYEELLSKK